MKRQSEGAFTSRRARRHPRPRPGHRRYHRRGPLQREREVALIRKTPKVQGVALQSPVMRLMWTKLLILLSLGQARVFCRQFLL